jgi:hypothetical protein
MDCTSNTLLAGGSGATVALGAAVLNHARCDRTTHRLIITPPRNILLSAMLANPNHPLEQPLLTTTRRLRDSTDQKCRFTLVHWLSG